MKISLQEDLFNRINQTQNYARRIQGIVQNEFDEQNPLPSKAEVEEWKGEVDSIIEEFKSIKQDVESFFKAKENKILILENSDLLDSEADLICHQVNCQGVMGSGVAKAISDKYPIVKKRYLGRVDSVSDKKNLLGQVQALPVSQEQFVVNMFSQFNYGRDGQQYTDYDAIRKCLGTIGDVARKNNYKVALPYLIGCGLGGGDWNIVYKIIEEELEGCEVYIHKIN